MISVPINLVSVLDVACPYCGEYFETLVDATGGDQSYIEDCQVCCRPIEFRLAMDHQDGGMRLDVRRDDD